MLEKGQLDAARCLLGTHSRYSFQMRPNSRKIQRWTWQCGCQLDGIECGEDREEFTFRWQRCDWHLDGVDVPA